MKFGDKLVLLRKKNGLSQEELAEKLGVSRQSVSKWESNNTYPETDKIVQICNIFDCSMDDLINDKVTNIEETSRKSKNNFNEVWDSLLEFITKTVNMFSHMKFTNGLKCIVEMIIVFLLLWLLGAIFCSISSSLIANIFSFLGGNIVNNIENVLKSIFSIFWFILTLIVLVHTFKIRYLNYYDDTVVVNKKAVDSSDKSDNIEDNNKEKIIVRDEKDKPFAFLGVLSKLIIYFIKFMVICIAIGLIGTILALIIFDVLSISFISTNIFFLGISFSMISVTILSILLLLLCIYFVIAKRINSKVFISVFIGSLLLFGIGIGISIISFKNIDIIEDSSNEFLESSSITTNYRDDLVIITYDNNKYNYIVDSNMKDDEIIISKNIDTRYEKLKSHETLEDEMNMLYVYSAFKGNYKDIYNKFVNDLKDNKIYFNNSSYDNCLTIKANQDTINKLISNLGKMYLVEEINNENGFNIITHESKVYFQYGIDGSYDAREDKLYLDDDDIQCERSIKRTKYGERIIYKCLEKEDYDE